MRKRKGEGAGRTGDADSRETNNTDDSDHDQAIGAEETNTQANTLSEGGGEVVSKPKKRYASVEENLANLKRWQAEDESQSPTVPFIKHGISKRKGGVVKNGLPLLIYTTAFFLWPGSSFLCVLLWDLHFIKRIFEVLYVHKHRDPKAHAGKTYLEVCYFLTFAAWIAFDHCYIGHTNTNENPLLVLAFIVCMIGNGYCHWRLKHMDPNKIPMTKPFTWVACPHYTCEVYMWISFALLCNSWVAATLAFTSFAVLVKYSNARMTALQMHFNGRKGQPRWPRKRQWALIPLVM